LELTFEPPDAAAFRCLSLAYEAGRLGGTAPAWLNAADECAVEAFLSGRIAWRDIAGVVESTLARFDGASCSDVETLLMADANARRVASGIIDRMDSSVAVP
jgi:1-deoxy-D-xylulose-5-phosphate reductoisomerase